MGFEWLFKVTERFDTFSDILGFSELLKTFILVLSGSEWFLKCLRLFLTFWVCS